MDDNHVYKLIKMILKCYCKVRLYHLGKETTADLSGEKIRKKLNKLVLCKHQWQRDQQEYDSIQSHTSSKMVRCHCTSTQEQCQKPYFIITCWENLILQPSFKFFMGSIWRWCKFKMICLFKYGCIGGIPWSVFTPTNLNLSKLRCQSNRDFSLKIVLL